MNSPPSPKSLGFRGTNFLRSADPYGGGSKCVCDTSVVVVDSGEEFSEAGAYSLTGCGRLDNSPLAMMGYHKDKLLLYAFASLLLLRHLNARHCSSCWMASRQTLTGITRPPGCLLLYDSACALLPAVLMLQEKGRMVFCMRFYVLRRRS